jgi:hypothetical protein
MDAQSQLTTLICIGRSVNLFVLAIYLLWRHDTRYVHIPVFAWPAILFSPFSDKKVHSHK